jgi:hypothetical protein
LLLFSAASNERTWGKNPLSPGQREVWGLSYITCKVKKGKVVPVRMRWAGHVARMGETRNAYRILAGKAEGKRPLGRPRRRWADDIKMDLGELGWDVRD